MYFRINLFVDVEWTVGIDKLCGATRCRYYKKISTRRMRATCQFDALDSTPAVQTAVHQPYLNLQATLSGLLLLQFWLYLWMVQPRHTPCPLSREYLHLSRNSCSHPIKISWIRQTSIVTLSQMFLDYFSSLLLAGQQMPAIWGRQYSPRTCQVTHHIQAAEYAKTLYVGLHPVQFR